MKHCILYTVALCSMVVGCVGRTGRKEGSAAPDAYRQSTDSFRIEFSELGGAAGTYAGYAIEGSGHVYKIHRIPGGKAEQTLHGTVSQEDMVSLRTIVDTIGFFLIDYSLRGNLVYSIEVRRGTDKNVVSWPAGDDAVPDDLETLRDYLINLVKKGQR
ncbi:MAG: hypothetical protein ABIL68_06800 [bacterium]